MSRNDLSDDVRRLQEKYNREGETLNYRSTDPDVINLERKHGKRIEELEKEVGPIFGDS